MTDASRLRQVLKNLLANAFKFTEQGNVSLAIGRPDSSWRSEGAEPTAAAAWIAISVADTGIGITAEVQDRIFDAFAQADGTTARHYGGTGLGLSISLELVRMLGGDIALTSAPGEGSTFTVHLPVTLGADAATSAAVDVGTPEDRPRQESNPEPRDGHSRPAPAAAAAPLSSPALSPLTPPMSSAGVALAGCTALIVDDDYRNIFALTALLRGVQIEVIRADTGDEALAILAQTPGVDIVLVDVMMPGMDGYETLRAMREMLGERQLPLVAFTAKVGVGERQRCLDAGASDYIPKPVSTAELLTTLGKWIPAAALAGRSAAPDDPAAPAGAVAELVPLGAPATLSANGHSTASEALAPLTPPSAPAGAELAGHTVLVVDDDFINIFAMTALLERRSLKVLSAESGAAALAMLEQTPGVDIVLVDIMMPGMDGYETLRAMREMLGERQLPLVAFTAKVGVGERQRCLDAGASDYISKPVSAGDLVAMLGTWLSPLVVLPANAAA